MRINLLGIMNRMLDDVVGLEWATADTRARARADTKALMCSEADINAINDARRTALHMAASKGDAEVLLGLLAAKADVDLQDKEGKSPLDMTDDERCKEILKAVGAHGWTRLMVAAEAGISRTKQYFQCRDALLCLRDGQPFPLWLADVEGSAGSPMDAVSDEGLNR